jgi:serine phosphatase RsbU (regulator of sigma subunit)
MLHAECFFAMAPLLSDEKPALMPWRDPLQAKIPSIHDGHVGAVYYGQRRCGDFYDFVRSAPNRVLFGLFDVAGKIEQTRPVVVALQEEFQQSGSRLLSPPSANESEAMLELWIEMNRAVMKAAGGVHSCPAFLGCYNEDLGTLCYVNAGHTPGIVRDRAETGELKATALPLGLFSHSVPECSVIVMDRGNAFLVVSKGIVEARHRGEEYGIERVKEYLQQSQFETAHETCVGILSRVQQFMGTAPTHNDVTALSVVRST